MKRQKAFALFIAVLFTALWFLPMVRAVSLLRDAQAYFAETSSINASNDLSFSSALLVSYIFSLASAFAIAWMDWSGSRLLILPVVILGYSVAEILRIRPEEPIVLFPVMHPWRPATLSLVALAIASAVFFAQWHHAKSRKP